MKKKQEFRCFQRTRNDLNQQKNKHIPVRSLFHWRDQSTLFIEEECLILRSLLCDRYILMFCNRKLLSNQLYSLNHFRIITKRIYFQREFLSEKKKEFTELRSFVLTSKRYCYWLGFFFFFVINKWNNEKDSRFFFPFEKNNELDITRYGYVHSLTYELKITVQS